MPTDESLIRQVIKRFEEQTGWGDSEQWSNQDFRQLSDLIREKTGVTISHVTLKRIWGKVKYESLPNTHTLNTLVQFLGYDNWRDFSVKMGEVPISPPPVVEQKMEEPRPRRWKKVVWMVAPLVVIMLVLLFLKGQQPPPQSRDYSFSSKKTVTSGLPNSVIFDYDASRSPDDSVVIQQSWDTTRRVKVPRSGHQYTSMYYYPDYYHATLRVHGQVVKQHSLLIRTDGWLPLVEQDPVPVYFKPQESIGDGKMTLSVDQIKAKNILLQPNPPTVMFANVRDFGEIYSDHFVFETRLKNDYAEGSAVCQMTRVYLLCEGTAIWVPLVAPGCVSTADLYFTYFYTSGKRDDLSPLGVNFNDYVKLRIESDSGKAKILVNDKLAYTVPRHILHSKIIGILYRFQGTGTVDYVSLSNGTQTFKDDF
ncbi:MAG TPA: helix-turn-helix domain-containing protein [Bryobacteraceae bacterium]